MCRVLVLSLSLLCSVVFSNSEKLTQYVQGSLLRPKDDKFHPGVGVGFLYDLDNAFEFGSSLELLLLNEDGKDSPGMKWNLDALFFPFDKCECVFEENYFPLKTFGIKSKNLDFNYGVEVGYGQDMSLWTKDFHFNILIGYLIDGVFHSSKSTVLVENVSPFFFEFIIKVEI